MRLKKVCLLCIVVFLFLNCAACGNKSPEIIETEPVFTDPELENDSTAIDVKQDLPFGWSACTVNGRNLNYGVPETWVQVQKAGSVVYHDGSKDSVYAVCVNWDKDIGGNPESILNLFKSFVVWDVADYCHGNIRSSRFDDVQSNSTSVNGYPASVFTATINNSKYDCPVFGHSFIINGNNIMVIGLVSKEKPEQADIEKCQNYVQSISELFNTN